MHLSSYIYHVRTIATAMLSSTVLCALSGNKLKSGEKLITANYATIHNLRRPDMSFMEDYMHSVGNWKSHITLKLGTGQKEILSLTIEGSRKPAWSACPGAMMRWSKQLCTYGENKSGHDTGYATVTEGNNFVVYNVNNDVIWETKTEGKGAKNGYLAIDDNGELVLFDGEDKRVWGNGYVPDPSTLAEAYG